MSLDPCIVELHALLRFELKAITLVRQGNMKVHLCTLGAKISWDLIQDREGVESEDDSLRKPQRV